MPIFNGLFDEWAETYDETVYGRNNEYREVFENYEAILKDICYELRNEENGKILEIGTGTGNLANVLYENKFNVIGIEPSHEMRKITKIKYPDIKILKGHFLSIPIKEKVDAIVTSYAFHHLTLKEKKEALLYMDSFLNKHGKIVIADTMFESKKYKASLLEHVKSTGALNLLNDLNTEYYEEIEDMISLFKNLNYAYEIKKMNKYVWIISARKEGL